MAAANVPAGGAPPAPAANPIAFARSPADASGARLIDYSTKEGSALYKMACEALPDKFDGEPSKLKLFLTRVKEKAIQYAWMPMITYQINNESETFATIMVRYPVPKSINAPPLTYLRRIASPRIVT